MYHWSKIPEEHRPEIISDVYDDRFLTFIVQVWNYEKILRKDAASSGRAIHAVNSRRTANNHFVIDFVAGRNISEIAWEGHYWNNNQVFKNIIDKNIPCVIMHKVKNQWCPEIDTVVCFMTGDTRDVFLVHPKDLAEWNPEEEINNV